MAPTQQQSEPVEVPAKRRSAQQIMRAHYRQQQLPPRTWKQAAVERERMDAITNERNKGARATYLAAAAVASKHKPTATRPIPKKAPGPNASSIFFVGAPRTQTGSLAGVKAASAASSRASALALSRAANSNTAANATMTTPVRNARAIARSRANSRSSSRSSSSSLGDSPGGYNFPGIGGGAQGSPFGTSFAASFGGTPRHSDEPMLRRDSSSSSLAAALAAGPRTSRQNSVSSTDSRNESLSGINGDRSASAAARASISTPINVAPRMPFPQKFVSSISQGLRYDSKKVLDGPLDGLNPEKLESLAKSERPDKPARAEKLDTPLEIPFRRPAKPVERRDTSLDRSLGRPPIERLNSERLNNEKFTLDRLNDRPTLRPTWSSENWRGKAATRERPQDRTDRPGLSHTTSYRRAYEPPRSSAEIARTSVDLQPRRTPLAPTRSPSRDSTLAASLAVSAQAAAASVPRSSFESTASAESDRQSALSAAVSAGTRVEANMANIHMQVNAAVQDARKKRDNKGMIRHYMPVASWSAPSRVLRMRQQNQSSSSVERPESVSPAPGSNANALGTAALGAGDRADSPAPRVTTPISAPGSPAPLRNNPYSSNMDSSASNSSSSFFQGSMFGGVPGPAPALPDDPAVFYSSGTKDSGVSKPPAATEKLPAEKPGSLPKTIHYQPMTNVPQKPSMRLPHTLRTKQRPRRSDIDSASVISTPSVSAAPFSSAAVSTPSLVTPSITTPVSALASSVPASVPIPRPSASHNSPYAALGLGYNNLGLGLEEPDVASSAGSDNSVVYTPVAQRIPLTLRHDSRRRFNEDKPWKGHKYQTDLTERERKRYESLWMANRGSHLAYLAMPEQFQAAWENAVQLYFNRDSKHRHLRPTHSHVSSNSVGSLQSAFEERPIEKHVERPADQGERQAERQAEKVEQAERQVEQVERYADMAAQQPAKDVQIERGELLDTLPDLNADLHPIRSGVFSDDLSSIRSVEPSGASDLDDPAFDEVSVASASEDEEDAMIEVERRADDVHGYCVSRLWRRSNLPEDTLAQIWNLVDLNKDGTLDRSGFVVGMWLCDQCLYGRKLPPKVSPELWQSAGKLNLKIRVKPRKTKLERLRKLPTFLGKTVGYTVHGGRTAVKKAVQTATSS